MAENHLWQSAQDELAETCDCIEDVTQELLEKLSGFVISGPNNINTLVLMDAAGKCQSDISGIVSLLRKDGDLGAVDKAELSGKILDLFTRLNNGAHFGSKVSEHIISVASKTAVADDKKRQGAQRNAKMTAGKKTKGDAINDRIREASEAAIQANKTKLSCWSLAAIIIESVNEGLEKKLKQGAISARIARLQILPSTDAETKIS